MLHFYAKILQYFGLTISLVQHIALKIKFKRQPSVSYLIRRINKIVRNSLFQQLFNFSFCETCACRHHIS